MSQQSPLFRSIGNNGGPLTEQQQRLCAENLQRLKAQRPPAIEPEPKILSLLDYAFMQQGAL